MWRSSCGRPTHVVVKLQENGECDRGAGVIKWAGSSANGRSISSQSQATRLVPLSSPCQLSHKKGLTPQECPCFQIKSSKMALTGTHNSQKHYLKSQWTGHQIFGTLEQHWLLHFDLGNCVNHCKVVVTSGWTLEIWIQDWKHGRRSIMAPWNPSVMTSSRWKRIRESPSPMYNQPQTKFHIQFVLVIRSGTHF